MAKASIEAERLRLALWRARGKNSRTIGVVMLLWSAVFLVSAYFTRYFLFEVTSIVALLLGVVLTLADLEPHLKMHPANKAILSLLNVLIKLMHDLKIQGKAVFVPFPDANSVRVWLPKDTALEISDFEKARKEGTMLGPNGLFLTSPGRGLFETYNEELDGIKGKDLEYLLEWLPKVMVEGLQLSSSVGASMKEDEVRTLFTRPMVRDLCQRREVNESICCAIGCPLTASVAEALAECTGRIVHHISCDYDPLKQEARAVHRLGKAVRARGEVRA